MIIIIAIIIINIMIRYGNSLIWLGCPIITIIFIFSSRFLGISITCKWKFE